VRENACTTPFMWKTAMQSLTTINVKAAAFVPMYAPQVPSATVNTQTDKKRSAVQPYSTPFDLYFHVF